MCRERAGRVLPASALSGTLDSDNAKDIPLRLTGSAKWYPITRHLPEF